MTWCERLCCVVQVRPISQLAIESHIQTLLSSRTTSNELLLTIAEDNILQSNMLFQALADGLNLGTAYSMSSTYNPMYTSLLFVDDVNNICESLRFTLVNVLLVAEHGNGSLTYPTEMLLNSVRQFTLLFTLIIGCNDVDTDLFMICFLVSVSVSVAAVVKLSEVVVVVVG